MSSFVNLAMLPGLKAAMKGETLFSQSADDKEHHPLANWLFRRFRPGSATLSKSDAYYIGNELDCLYARIVDLEAKLAQAEAKAVRIRALNAGVEDAARKAMATLESLTGMPT